jgi:hypothetical protein
MRKLRLTPELFLLHNHCMLAVEDTLDTGTHAAQWRLAPTIFSTIALALLQIGFHLSISVASCAEGLAQAF